LSDNRGFLRNADTNILLAVRYFPVKLLLLVNACEQTDTASLGAQFVVINDLRCARHITE